MSPLNDDQTLRLLHIAASDVPRPLEDLCERLRAPDGARWIDQEITAIAGREGILAQTLINGSVDLASLNRLKHRGRVLATDTMNARDRLTGLLVHDIAVAAALAHCRTLISTRPRDLWNERLIALAGSAPEPWRTFFRKAADTEPSSQSSG